MQYQQTPPWFEPYRHSNPDKTAVVIGGGLSGTSTAWSLAKRGWQVVIIEQHDSLAREASGNPQGIIYAKLSADQTPLSRFIMEGYHYTLALLEELNLPKHGWQPCGVIQMAIDEKTKQRYLSLNQQHPDTLLKYLSKKQLSDIAGLPLNLSGLYFPNAGWLHPRALCKALACHQNIRVITSSYVDTIVKEPVKTSIKKSIKTQIKHHDGHNSKWFIKVGSQVLAESNTVIIAQGTASSSLPNLKHLPLKSIRGQITKVKSTKQSQRLMTCVCGEGYIAPSVDGFHTLGATFNFGDNTTSINYLDHMSNIEMQAKRFPAMYHAIGAEQANILGGRVGFRCTTPDYLPMVGTVVNYERFIEQYAPLRKNRKYHFLETPNYLDGLFVNAGHGSRGILSCPLSGELLAGIITGQMETSIQPDLLNAIHPSRFLVRDLARNKI